MVPRIFELEDVVNRAKDNAAALSRMEKMFDKVTKDKAYENAKVCRKMKDIWTEFRSQFKDGKDMDAKFGTDPKKAFQAFLEKYKQFDNDWFEKKKKSGGSDLDEAMYSAYGMTADLFGDGPDEDVLHTVFEDDPPKKPLTQDQITKLCGGI